MLKDFVGMEGESIVDSSLDVFDFNTINKLVGDLKS